MPPGMAHCPLSALDHDDLQLLGARMEARHDRVGGVVGPPLVAARPHDSVRPTGLSGRPRRVKGDRFGERCGDAAFGREGDALLQLATNLGIVGRVRPLVPVGASRSFASTTLSSNPPQSTLATGRPIGTARPTQAPAAGSRGFLLRALV